MTEPGMRKKGHRKGAPRPRAEGPERRCIVSGEVMAKEDLIRFVAGPDGEVVPDLDGSLPGRGLWLSARRDMVETATRKKAFSRAARRQLTAPPDLAERVEYLLRMRCLDTLGFARRAGLVVAGYDKVRAAAKGGDVALLLEATEGSADGRRKITALVPDALVIDWFTGADLASVLGREHVVHVSVSPGQGAQRPLVARLRDELDRLGRYAGLSAGSGDSPTGADASPPDAGRQADDGAQPPTH